MIRLPPPTALVQTIVANLKQTINFKLNQLSRGGATLWLRGGVAPAKKKKKKKKKIPLDYEEKINRPPQH